jgi:hypothetical protein
MWNARQIWIYRTEQKREDKLITLTLKNGDRGLLDGLDTKQEILYSTYKSNIVIKIL